MKRAASGAMVSRRVLFYRFFLFYFFFLLFPGQTCDWFTCLVFFLLFRFLWFAVFFANFDRSSAQNLQKKTTKKKQVFRRRNNPRQRRGFLCSIFFFRCTRNLRCRFDDFHRSWYCFLFFGEGVGLIKMAVSMQSSSNFGRYISLFFYRVPTRMDHSRVLSLLTSIPFFFGFFGFFFHDDFFRLFERGVGGRWPGWQRKMCSRIPYFSLM